MDAVVKLGKIFLASIFVLIILALSPVNIVGGFWFAYQSLITLFFVPRWIKEFFQRQDQRKIDREFRKVVGF